MNDSTQGSSVDRKQRIAALEQQLIQTKQELSLLKGRTDGSSSPLDAKLSPPRRTEETLRRSNTLLWKNARSISQIGSWALDITLDRLTWSDEMFPLFGINRSSFEGHYQSYLSLVHPDDLHRVQVASAAARSKTAGDLLDLEYRILRPDGSIRVLYERGKVAFNEQGNPISAAGVVMDVTEMKILEESYRALFEQSAVGMSTHSERGNFLSANRKLCEILGYSEEELWGLSYFEIILPEDRESAIAEIGKLLRGDTDSATLEARTIRKDGGVGWINLTLSRLNRNVNSAVLSGVALDITERKIAEMELIEKDALLGEAQTIAGLGSYVLDIACGIWVSSEVLDNILGISKSYTRNLEGWTNLIHPDDRAMAAKYFIDEVLGKGTFFDREYRIIRQNDGVERWVHGAGRLELDSQGKPAKMRGTIQDITDRRRTEAAMRENEESLRDAQRIAGVGSYVLDVPSGVWSGSDVLFETLGMDKSGEHHVRRWIALIPPDDYAQLVAQLNSVVTDKGTQLNAECRIIRENDQALRWVHVIGKQEFNAQGQPTQMRGTVQDITERKLAESELRESKRLLQLFIQHAPVALAMFDCELRYIAANPSWIEDSDLVGKNVIGQHHYDVMPDIPQHWRDANERALAGEPVRVEEDCIGRIGGRTLWLCWEVRPWRRDNGEIGGIIIFSENITKRKLGELDLERTRRALEMLSRCNAALVRAENENSLLEQICKIAVEIGAFRMASVLYAQEDEQKTILPVGHAGFDDDYLSEIKLSWSQDSPHGMGPAGRTIRSGQPVVVPDLSVDPDYLPWVAPATARGYRSVVSLPLKSEDRTFGVFGLYSAETRKISAEEVQLLHELADDLTFGIMSLRSKVERQQLLQAITTITEEVSSSTGVDFYERLLLTLVNVLGACAGVITGDQISRDAHVSPICAVVDGQLVHAFQYKLKGTPCINLDQDKVLVIERELQKQYPAAPVLQTLKAEAYAGLNLFAAGGKRIGTIFVLFRQPLTRVELITSTLKLFAARTAAEMVREESDRTIREQALLLDKAKDAIIVRDLNHRVVYWNLGAERLFGWSALEAVGKSILSFKIVDREAFLAAFEHLMQRGEWAGELCEQTKDGRLLTVECHWTLVKADDGTPMRVLAISTDVTERKRSEAQLRLLEASVARLNDIVLITEADPLNEPGPRIVFVNDAFERLTGYSREEVIGRSPRILQGPGTNRAELDRVRTALETGIAIRAELINYAKDGMPYWIEMDIVPLPDSTGSHQYMVAVERDITERKRAEAQLHESDARLAHAQKLESIGQLTGGIAHDFNNLLTVILGNSEILAEHLQDNARLFSLAKMIRTAGERGAELTNRLLAIARRQSLEPKAINAGSVLQEMLPLLGRTLGENICIEASLQDGTWFMFADPSQLDAAILNLCINARDAMPSGGNLLIEVSNIYLDQTYASNSTEVVPGEYVMVAITDTGTGIAPEVIGHVFEPFFTTKPKGRGTGLGLSMVYGFAKQSGGHVRIYSEPGIGTTVKLYLPRADSAQASSNYLADASLSLNGHETVLLVEDDELVRDYATQLLGELGYRTLTAKDGPSALEIVMRGENIDLLFTDVIMPGGMSGPQLAVEIEKLRPGLPALFASGYTENAIVHQGHVDPSLSLLQKPYTKRRLAEKLRHALRKSTTSGGS